MDTGPLLHPSYPTFRLRHLPSTPPMMFPRHFLQRLERFLQRKTLASRDTQAQNGQKIYPPVVLLRMNRSMGSAWLARRLV